MEKVKIPNKGYGYVATKNIGENTIVLIDQSVVNIGSADCTHVLASILSMCDKTRQRFDSLVPHFKDEYFYEVETVISHKHIRKEDLFDMKLLIEKYKRNAFNLDNSHSTIKPAILLDGAIFNHSCDPNISFTCKDSKMYFFSNRDIVKGEELCISYIDVMQNHVERKKQLLSRYGFVCGCELCVSRKNIDKTRGTKLKHNKFANVSCMRNLQKAS